MSQVFALSFHVTGTLGSIMPAELGGAYVRCYASGADYQAAGDRMVARLKTDGLRVEEVFREMLQFESGQWAAHVDDNWPEHAASLVDQAEFELAMTEGRVVYGPFAAFNPQ